LKLWDQNRAVLGSDAVSLQILFILDFQNDSRS